MTLSWRQRIFLVGIVLSSNIFALGLSAVSQKMNNSLNFQDAYFFNGNQYVEFELRNASSDMTYRLRLTGNPVNETHTLVNLTQNNNLIGEFFVSPDGWLYNGSQLQEFLYSIWWIYVPNIVTFFGVSIGDEFNVSDPTGFFGPKNINYTYEVEDKYVFYPYLPQHRNLSGAQSSFEAGLYTKIDHKKIGTFLFDTTSGAMEQADYYYNGSSYQLLLTETSYGISRNRFVLIGFHAILGLIFIGSLWVISRWKKKRGKKTLVPENDHEKVQFFALLATGFLCNILNVLDTWFYHSIGYIPTILIDIGFSVLLSIICIRGKYGIKWILPSILELLYASPHRGRQIIPFIGNFLAWIAVIWASGVMKDLKENQEDSTLGKKQTKWDKVMEEII